MTPRLFSLHVNAPPHLDNLFVSWRTLLLITCKPSVIWIKHLLCFTLRRASPNFWAYTLRLPLLRLRPSNYGRSLEAGLPLYIRLHRISYLKGNSDSLVKWDCFHTIECETDHICDDQAAQDVFAFSKKG